MNTCGKIAAGVLLLALVSIGFLAAVYAIGTAIETVGQHQDEHRMCLRGATNGLEIERCK